MTIQKYGNRFWGVWDGTTLVCVALHQKFALEIIRSLSEPEEQKEELNDEDRPDPRCS